MANKAKGMAIFRVVSGNFLEMFDFMVYGFYAAYIARAFFPSENPTASLMASFAAFGAGFLMRPLGAIFLGAYIDRKGRKQGLLITLGLMALGTLLIAITPSYESIGIIAPLIVLLGRLLQGFSAGVELGGTSIYLAEIATEGNRGFYVSWQSASQQVSVIAASGLGVLLHSLIGDDIMHRWGWRIPFFCGCLIVPILFYIRTSLQETEAFLHAKHRPTLKEVVHSLYENYRLIIAGVAMVAMTTTSFYLITAYTPTFGKEVLKLSALDSLIVTACVGLSNFMWLPLMGSVSDRIGRKPLLVGATAVAIITAYPALVWLASAPSFTRLLVVELWLSFLYASYNSAMVVALAELMPVNVRTTGFSLAYSLATAIFGGFTPLICTWLIAKAQSLMSTHYQWLANAMPGIWLSAVAMMSLLAIILLYNWQKHLHYSHHHSHKTTSPP